MKRFLSVLTLLALTTVFYYVQHFLSSLALKLFDEISGLSTGIFVVLMTVLAPVVLGIAFSVIFFGGVLAVGISHKICLSRRGLRYKVLGCAYILFYIMGAFLKLKGIIITGDSAAFWLDIIVMIAYSIVVMIIGSDMSKRTASL